MASNDGASDARDLACADVPDAQRAAAQADAIGCATLAELYRDQYDQFLRFARIRTGSPNDAEDIVQDAFLDVGRSYAGKPAEELRKLLFVTIRNKSTNLSSAARTKAARRSVEIGTLQEVLAQTGAPSAEQRVIDRELISIVDEIVGSMKPRRREILQLHRIEGLTYDEIAERLAISSSAVKYNLARAVATLARQLSRRTDE